MKEKKLKNIDNTARFPKLNICRRINRNLYSSHFPKIQPTFIKSVRCVGDIFIQKKKMEQQLNKGGDANQRIARISAHLNPNQVS